MTINVLSVNPRKCDGCGDCETVCSEKHSGSSGKAFSRIRVVGGNGHGRLFVPFVCRQCDDPPCMSVCQNSAIYRDDKLHRNVIDPNKCIGCKMCFSACPFGAIGFDSIRGFAYKCELCGGDPECVNACEKGAIEYIKGYDLNSIRMRESANKHYAVIRNQI